MLPVTLNPPEPPPPASDCATMPRDRSPVVVAATRSSSMALLAIVLLTLATTAPEVPPVPPAPPMPTPILPAPAPDRAIPPETLKRARAAAAADRLGEDRVAVVAFGMRASEHVEVDVAGIAAAAARAADADVDPDRAGARGVERAADVEAARAAAAADALGDDRAGLVAEGRGNPGQLRNRPTCAEPPSPPEPPRPTPILPPAAPEKLSPPVTLNAPAPPPPPTDCAVKPAD